MKVIQSSEGRLVRPRTGDNGYDIRTPIGFQINPGETVCLSVDIAVELPRFNRLQKLLLSLLGMGDPEYVFVIKDRSSMAYRQAAHSLRTVQVSGGVVDSSYRGFISVILTNTGKSPAYINKDEKIAQGLLSLTFSPEIQNVKNLSQSLRGSKGFGSTGL